MMNKGSTVHSEEDFDLMGDMPKEDPAVAKVEIRNLVKHFDGFFFSVEWHEKMKSPKNSANIY